MNNELAVSNNEAERAVVGSMLRDPTCAGYVLQRVREEFIFDQQAREVFVIAKELESKFEGSCDAVTVAHEIEDRGPKAVEVTGGRKFLEELMASVPSLSFLENHVRIVIDGWRRRRVAQLGRFMNEAADSPGADVDKILKRLQAETDLVAAASRHQREMMPWGKVAQAWVQELEKRQKGEGTKKTIPSHVPGLNGHLGGGVPVGEITVVAARPGMGKTALALDLAEHAGREGPVLFFSLEMTAEDLMARWLAKHSIEGFSRLKTASLEEAGKVFKAIKPAVADAKGVQILVCDSADVSPSKVRSFSREVQREYQGLSMVVIDYLQLMTPDPSSGKRNRSKEQEVAEMSRKLKILAKDLNVPVVLLSQLNRQAESREDHRPRLSDLRDSGSIEQDAYAVLLLFRPTIYWEDTENDPDEIIIAKNRGGKTGVVLARFKGSLFTWRPWL
ncbi:MAG: hypothetical protein DWQ01_08515 [Planctomycetota bacterium]|nr:MAG: hypothetical protein DWQ01_08515 [Planctomycetota bacterium]